MLSASEIADARLDLEGELPDVVRLWRDTGTKQFNEVTFQEDPVWELEADNVPALIVQEARNVAQVVQGEQPVFLRHYHVTIPADREPLLGWYVEVVTSEDDTAVGQVLAVRDVKLSSVGISRRMVAQQNLTELTWVWDEESS